MDEQIIENQDDLDRPRFKSMVEYDHNQIPQKKDKNEPNDSFSYEFEFSDSPNQKTPIQFSAEIENQSEKFQKYLVNEQVALNTSQGNESNELSVSKIHQNEEEFRKIIRSFEFYYRQFILIVILASNIFYTINAKSLGIVYYSESFINKTIIFMPIMNAIGRIFGCFIIETYSYQKLIVYTVIIHSIILILFNAYIDKKMAFAFLLNLMQFTGGMLTDSVSYFFIWITRKYNAEITVRLQNSINLHLPITILIVMLSQEFIYNSYGLGAVTFEFIQFYSILLARINLIE